MKPEAVIFDVDGTLIDSLEARYQTLKEISKRMGLRVLAKEDIRELMRSNRPPWDFLIPQDREDKKEATRQCHKITEEIWSKVYRQEAKLIPQALETLEKLAAAGIKIGIASAGWQQALKTHEWGRKIYRLCSVIITREDIPAVKPAPDSIIECMKRLGIPASNAVSVGDSPLDIRAGKAAGTMTIGVLTGVSNYENLFSENPDMILPAVVDLLTTFEL